MVENQINNNHQAYKELGLLFILVAVAILTFSSLVYFAEKVLLLQSHIQPKPPYEGLFRNDVITHGGGVGSTKT